MDNVFLNVDDQTYAKLKERFEANGKPFVSRRHGDEMFFTVPVTLYVTPNYPRNTFQIHSDDFKDTIVRVENKP